MMKFIFNLFIFNSTLLLIIFCNANAQNKNYKLSATDFKAKMDALPHATLLDVRTQDEYSKGHINNALNTDWTDSILFVIQTNLLDMNNPVFVYCLLGGRSEAAANYLRHNGFKEVYELEGGIMKWRAAGFPEVISPAAKGMSNQDFDEEVTCCKLVLIEFYADWCIPCRKIAPYIDEISNELSEKLKVVRINSDNNLALTKQLKLDGLPALLIYKDKDLYWQHIGYITKEELEKQIIQAF